MDYVRYFLGVLSMLTLPAAVCFWLVIHPLIGIWRRTGPVAAYVTAFASMIAVAAVMFVFLDRLLGRDLGTNWLTFAIGLGLYAAAFAMERMVRRELKWQTLVGIPEIVPSERPQTLLTKGIYSLVRHPRYLMFIVSTMGFGLIVNYVGVYLLAVFMVPALYLIAVLEERELVDRYGEEYLDYRSRVPRIIPTRKSVLTFRQSLARR